MQEVDQSSSRTTLPTLAEIFNHLLLVCRDENGKRITVRDIALHSPGVSVDTLYQIKQGRNENPGLAVIQAICAALKVPPILLMPKLWGMNFKIPPSMPGFPSFPNHEQFSFTKDES
jgi:hypothetical protein